MFDNNSNMIIKSVPFFSNTKDNTHCYQACLKMILGYFIADRRWSWEELDQLTNKLPNMWTWPMAGLMNLQKMGFDVKEINNFDYMEFSTSGIKYIEDTSGKEIAAMQEEHSDIGKEMKESRVFVKTNIHKKRTPTFNDIKRLLNEGYLLIADVNLKLLNNLPGMDNHFVVIYGLDTEKVYFHDPGFPPVKSREEKISGFKKAWCFPKDEDASLKAIK